MLVAFVAESPWTTQLDTLSWVFAGPLSPSLTVPQPPVELTPQEVTELGYMPLRDDFERVSYEKQD